jgi:hypothetical protein
MTMDKIKARLAEMDEQEAKALLNDDTIVHIMGLVRKYFPQYEHGTPPFDAKVEEIVKHNKLKNCHHVLIGQRIEIPITKAEREAIAIQAFEKYETENKSNEEPISFNDLFHYVQKGDTLDSIIQKYFPYLKQGSPEYKEKEREFMERHDLENNPIMKNDPSGLKAVDWQKALDKAFAFLGNKTVKKALCLGTDDGGFASFVVGTNGSKSWAISDAAGSLVAGTSNNNAFTIYLISKSTDKDQLYNKTELNAIAKVANSIYEHIGIKVQFKVSNDDTKIENGDDPAYVLTKNAKDPNVSFTNVLHMDYASYKIGFGGTDIGRDNKSWFSNVAVKRDKLVSKEDEIFAAGYLVSHEALHFMAVTSGEYKPEGMFAKKFPNLYSKTVHGGSPDGHYNIGGNSLSTEGIIMDGYKHSELRGATGIPIHIKYHILKYQNYFH